jgi:hypothetical protein
MKESKRRQGEENLEKIKKKRKWKEDKITNQKNEEG